VSALSLKAVESANVQALVATLTPRLNGSSEPLVSISAEDDLVSFRADTWQPLLLARVEDALDELLGPTWRCAFSWA
jgi:hypothetical protein